MAKELAMVENNEIGRKIRRYFIEVEKRYRTIVEEPQNIFDFMRLAINQIEANEKKIQNVKSLSESNLKKSENNLPHSNLIGAIARQLGYKTSYKHHYEDKYIAVVPDVSRGNDFWQVYYKPIAVEQIINWFNENKEETEYKIIYQRNTKKGTKGEIKEKGFKIDNFCYKII